MFKVKHMQNHYAQKFTKFFAQKLIFFRIKDKNSWQNLHI